MTQISFHTDLGLRENLEDAAIAITVYWGVPHRHQVTILTVADGAGGHNSGEVASDLAIRSIPASIAKRLMGTNLQESKGRFAPEWVVDALSEALANANEIIVQEAGMSPQRSGMATTVVCGVVVGNLLHLAWAGDSRCYLYRGGRFRQLTHDHSEVQRLIDRGLIGKEEADGHPLAHTINRYLGQPTHFVPATRMVALWPGDIVVMSSDGMTDVLAEDQIADVVRSCQLGRLSLEELPVRLTDEALAYGASDNVTVLCYEHVPVPSPSNPLTAKTLTGAYPIALTGVFQDSKET